MTSSFTGSGMRRAPFTDRFRLGDVWRALNDIDYLVHRGIAVGAVCLKPVPAHKARTGARIIHMRASSVRGFRRIKWGGQP